MNVRTTPNCFNTASVLIQPADLIRRFDAVHRFNTASVLIQRPSIAHSCGTVCCFNTASVLIQLLRKQLAFVLILGFNTASVLIQRGCKLSDFLPCPVSIQLLFLFNHLSRNEEVSHSSFNTASVLIQLFTSESKRDGDVFQYSFCSYSTHEWAIEGLAQILFQYSFCSYSTKQK